MREQMEKQNDRQFIHRMTTEGIAAFLTYEAEQGASPNMLRRFRCTVRLVFDDLPEDKVLTKESLDQWRKRMETGGLSPVTVQNHVKYINRYLNFMNCPELCIRQGRGKNIAGRSFGYLTAVEPTAERDRRDVVWRCRCKCGNTVMVSATRLLRQNDLSCGCLGKEWLQRANRYIDQTSLRQALTERTESGRAASGYTGVSRKRNKWQAYITYKGRRYSLGCYSELEDAVKARARAKEWVREDAKRLQQLYGELHQTDPTLPRRG